MDWWADNQSNSKFTYLSLQCSKSKNVGTRHYAACFHPILPAIIDSNSYDVNDIDSET